MTIRHTLTIAGLSLFGLLLALPGAVAQEQAMDHSKHAGMEQQEQAGQASADMPARCQKMMEKKKMMKEKCAMMDAKLDELTAAMNTATGQEKIDAMAVLLNELVNQRKSMHAMMHRMMEEKMGMMSSAGGGMSSGDMSRCKMKKKMMSKEGSSQDTSGE